MFKVTNGLATLFMIVITCVMVWFVKELFFGDISLFGRSCECVQEKIEENNSWNLE